MSRRDDAFDNVLPFRRRVLLGALVAGLALVCVAGGLAWHQYDDARQSAVNDARARVFLAGAMIDTYFSGELAALSAIAQAPPVLAQDTRAMHTYLSHVQPAQGGPFPGGIGWIDNAGIYRVSSTAPAFIAPRTRSLPDASVSSTTASLSARRELTRWSGNAGSMHMYAAPDLRTASWEA